MNNRYTVVRIDGQTPLTKRQQIIDDFNSNCHIKVIYL